MSRFTSGIQIIKWRHQESIFLFIPGICFPCDPSPVGSSPCDSHPRAPSSPPISWGQSRKRVSGRFYLVSHKPTAFFLESQFRVNSICIKKKKKKIKVLFLKTRSKITGRQTPQIIQERALMENKENSHLPLAQLHLCIGMVPIQKCSRVFQLPGASVARIDISKVSRLVEWKQECCWQMENWYSPSSQWQKNQQTVAFLTLDGFVEKCFLPSILFSLNISLPHFSQSSNFSGNGPNRR